jgi:N-sulfoglucosamine sulfohydrolase
MKTEVSKKPNIVFLVSDDHGTDAAGPYGNPAIDTPALDRLAQEGVTFTHGCCTTASCAPSRSVMLTGLHNHTNGTYGLTHATHHFACFEDTKTLPVYLRELGYTTGRVGKRHYQPERIFPFDWEEPKGAFGRDDVAMSKACEKFIRTDKPFFLHWCSHNPHRGRILEDHPLRADSFGNPARSFSGDNERPYADSDVIIPPFLSDTPEVRAELAQYYQSISRLDRGIAALIEILKRNGKYENTVIIYISDNGSAFPESKTTLYDPGMRLPCIIRDPFASKQGHTNNALISWTDLTPTILDYAGLEDPNGPFFGKSFRSTMEKEEAASWKKELFASHSFHEVTNYYPMRAIRTHTHKFIWNIAWKLDYSFASDLWRSATWQGVLRDKPKMFGSRSVDAYIHRPRFELYDLLKDPNETENIAEEPATKGMVDDFITKMKQFQQETADPWYHKWRYE